MTQRIIDPVLNIFVGTSPTIVAQAVHRQLRKLPEPDRRRVANLMIDTMRLSAGATRGVEWYGSDFLQIQVPRLLSSSGWTQAQLFNLYVSALGNRQHKPGISSAGAGGIRNNAHVAFCALASSIQQRVIEKLNQISLPSPDRQDERVSTAVRINIVTFLGGGTGSGVVPALALLTRYLARRREDNTQTAIYAILPEQPRGLTEEMRRRQRSNAFSALLELMTLLRLKDLTTQTDYVLGPLTLDVSQLQAVDVVYLYGHGRVTDHDDIYEHIAMDLMLRIQDGHGAGAERKRQLPDISALRDRDGRELPTCFATSGVTEVVLPRRELITAMARYATLQVLNSANAAPADMQQADARSQEVATGITTTLDQEIERLTADHDPGHISMRVVEAGQNWQNEVDTLVSQFRSQMTASQPALVQRLVEIYQSVARTQGAGGGGNSIARERHFLQRLAELLQQASDRLGPRPSVARNPGLEQTLFGSPPLMRTALGWLPGRGSSDAASYADERLRESLDAVAHDVRRAVLSDLLARVNNDARHLAGSQIGTGGANYVLTNDERNLLENARVPFGHRYYTRMAFPTGEFNWVRQLYNSILHRLGLIDQSGNMLMQNVSNGMRATNAPTNGGFAQQLEWFFINHVFEPAFVSKGGSGSGWSRQKTILETILEYGGENLLRVHVRWGLEWALSHLKYHATQESTTSGRIARQLDVAVNCGSGLTDHREIVRRIIQEEMTRSEVQDGFKLLDSVDDDRISFLYSEYGVPVRAIDGMHESNNSYLTDYIQSQAQWNTQGTMPPHSSDLMVRQVREPVHNNQALVQLMADDPAQIDIRSLYP